MQKNIPKGLSRVSSVAGVACAVFIFFKEAVRRCKGAPRSSGSSPGRCGEVPKHFRFFQIRYLPRAIQCTDDVRPCRFAGKRSGLARKQFGEGAKQSRKSPMGCVDCPPSPRRSPPGEGEAFAASCRVRTPRSLKLAVRGEGIAMIVSGSKFDVPSCPHSDRRIVPSPWRNRNSCERFALTHPPGTLSPRRGRNAPSRHEFVRHAVNLKPHTYHA